MDMNEKNFPPHTKIFIVEDDAFINNLLTHKLEGQGCTVGTINTGDRAIEEIKKFNPDIIVLDIMLPGIDGLEVLKKLKEDPSTRLIPTIILSNVAEKTEFDKAKKLGADSYLVKATLSIDEIAAELAKHLATEQPISA